MIGAGVFISSGLAMQKFESPFWILVCWVVGGIVAMCGGLTYAEWALMYPESGGDVPYLKRAFSNSKDMFAFVFLFLRVFVANPMCASVLSFVCYKFTWEVFSFPHNNIVMIMACVTFQVIAYSLLALSGSILPKCASFLTIVKMGILFVLILLGIVSIFAGEHKGSFENDIIGTFDVGKLASAFLMILFCYDGFSNLSTVVDKLRDPPKDTLKAIVAGCGSVAAFYLFVNVIFFGVLDSVQFKAAKLNQAAEFAYQAFKNLQVDFPIIKNFANGLVFISAFGALWGISFAAAELARVGAEKVSSFPLSGFLQKKHEVYDTSFNAITFHIILSLCYTPFLVFEETADLYFAVAILCNWCFYVITAIALIYYRFKAPCVQRKFKVFLGCPILVIVTGFLILVAKLTHESSMEKLHVVITIAIFIVGLILYFVKK